VELPELGELDLENPSFSASGPAEYTVSFGRPCRVAANVRLDNLMFSWPRIYAKALVSVYKCDEYWPHFDVKTRAMSVGQDYLRFGGPRLPPHRARRSLDPPGAGPPLELRGEGWAPPPSAKPSARYYT
jgi:hypothetical protein